VWAESETKIDQVINLHTIEHETYREDAFPEDDNIHVDGLEVCWTVRILVESAKANQIIVTEEFDFLTGFLH
jgi:hypothetical protein